MPQKDHKMTSLSRQSRANSNRRRNKVNVGTNEQGEDFVREEIKADTSAFVSDRHLE